MSNELKRGMLIRNLRGIDIGVDVVLDVKGASKEDDEIRVATENNPDGINQILIADAEIRWPWEPETAWRRVTA